MLLRGKPRAGDWLDGKNFPSYIKAKVREIFRSHQCYRKEYAGDADVVWLLKWPKVGKDLVGFIEGAVFRSSPHEDYTLRQALRNGKTAQDHGASPNKE